MPKRPSILKLFLVQKCANKIPKLTLNKMPNENLFGNFISFLPLIYLWKHNKFEKFFCGKENETVVTVFQLRGSVAI